MELRVTGPFIRLDQAMKLAELVSSGAEAKILIQGGEVLLNGEICTMRGKKLVDGDTFEFDGQSVTVRIE